MECFNNNMGLPYGFNALKHHLQFCRGYIADFKISVKNWHEKLKEDFICIGSNVIDVYEGNYSVPILESEFSRWLNGKGIKNREDLISCLNKKGYIQIKVLDDSQWIIRLGKEKDRYIHLHPAKKGKWLYRTKGNAWKTALTVAIFTKTKENFIVSTDSINMIREKILKFSPISSLEESHEIVRCLKKLL